MPNHVDNDFWVKGKLVTLNEFAGFALDTDQSETALVLSANKFIPYPKVYKDLDDEVRRLREKNPTEGWKVKDGFNSGGYEWCCDNWGTKWGIYNANLVRQGKTSLFYRFETAWSVCRPVISAMSRRFPELEFTLKYYERGMGFKGIYKIKNSDILLDKEEPYKGNRGG